jgi:hypothetical protein
VLSGEGEKEREVNSGNKQLYFQGNCLRHD